MSELGNDITSALGSVTGDWKKAKRTADTQDRVSYGRIKKMRYRKPPKTSIKEASFEVMKQAINHASSNGKYYANARQIMYAARPLVMELTDGRIWKNAAYFTQTILKDYIELYGASRVVWDARGHLYEPHVNNEIELGGAQVMAYQNDKTKGDIEQFPMIDYDKILKTKGATNRFGAALFIEKEGWNFQLQDAKIPEKWDIALMSAKGIPNKASIDAAASLGVPILALHDFDLAGFKIVKTLRRGVRLTHGISNLIDIGLRLKDVNEYGLSGEPVIYDQRKDPKIYLRGAGATTEECNYLVSEQYGSGWGGQRVEINMFTTEQLIEFLEKKFEEHGIKKIIPNEEKLIEAYKRAMFCHSVTKEIEEIEEEIESEEWEIPSDLIQQVENQITKSQNVPWDKAVWTIAEENFQKEDE